MSRSPRVYETLRAVGGGIADMEAHLDRMARSARFVGLRLDRAAAVLALCAAADGADRRLVLTLSGAGLRCDTAELDVARVGRAVRCVLARAPRCWPPAWVKAPDRWSPTVLAEEVIWTHRGAMLEANKSNVIAVRQGVLWTAPAGRRILAGITRAAVIARARALGVPVRIEAPPVAMVWDELYLCSTLKLLAPVASLDGQQAPGPGPVGEALLAGLWGALPGPASFASAQR